MIKKHSPIIFIIFTQLIFIGCLNKKGKDEHPEIPNFPITTNNTISIKHIMDKYANNFFYSDSLLLNFTSDTIETYDVLKRCFTKEKLSFLCYNNASFICFQNEKCIAIDDKNFSKRELIYYNDEYKKFSEISDSLRVLRKDPTQDLDSELIDSLFINYFYKKHNIITKNDLFADKIGTNYYYVKTNTSEFIIYSAPSPLIDIFDEAWFNKKIIKKNNFKTIETIDNEVLKDDAKYWLVRGEQVALQYTKQDYINAGIELKEYEPNTISADEVAKLVVLNHRDLFRATDQELYKSIPKDLKKILVLDEWFHKDFEFQMIPSMTDEQIKKTYDFNKKVTGVWGLTFEQFAKMTKKQELEKNTLNNEMWENNRPSSYETWQLIAKVIELNDPQQYKPTLEPNTHWSNWLDSGSL